MLQGSRFRSVLTRTKREREIRGGGGGGISRSKKE